MADVIEKLKILDSKSNAEVLHGRQRVDTILKDSTGNEALVNVDGQLHTVLKGKVDISNSTSIPLAADGVFTGSAVDTLEFAVITVFIYSDVESVIDGLSVEFSSDAINWDGLDKFTIPAGTGKTFSFQPQACYYRVVYTNASVDQTEFRLQSILKKSYVKPSSHRIGEEISGEDDSELVKAAVTGRSPNGDWKNVNVTEDGDLSISDNSSGSAIAEGLVTGKTNIHKFGRSGALAQNVVTHVWDYSATEEVYEFSGTADIDTISSSNVGDTTELELQGLDSNYSEVTQYKNLTGQTKVVLDTPMIRTFRKKNTGFNDLLGDAYTYPDTAITNGVPTDTSTVRAYMNNGNNQTLMAIYTIPNAKKGLLNKWFCTLAGKTNAVVEVQLWARPFGQVFQLKESIAISGTGNSVWAYEYKTPLVFNEQTDFYITADSASVNAVVSAGFDIDLKVIDKDWDIDGFVFDRIKFDISNESTAPRGIFFNDIGTKYYVVDPSDQDTVYEYDLTQSWNVRSAVYNSVSLNISGQASSARDIFFSSDGTKMYIIDNGSDVIFQYTLSTPWSLVGAVYSGLSLDISNECAEPDGFFIDDTGTRLFTLCNDTDKIFSYTLSTPWDISSGTYDTKEYDLNAGDNHQVWFRNDGTRMYVVRASTKEVREYDLSIAWDITTAINNGVVLITSTNATNPRGMYIRNDGRFLSLVDTDTDSVYQYRLN